MAQRLILLITMWIVLLVAFQAQAGNYRGAGPEVMPSKPLVKITPLQDGRYILEPLAKPQAPGPIDLAKDCNSMSSKSTQAAGGIEVHRR